ncbi:hypothetical protein K437DRAFT_179269 [Tilletiaria anomala UBC 951]|uniref:Uncharacterized protein n=1 Tax=Tilletiaria anomala (strain ATCC 24038 / CBS 436.72 / UBC 951) TaxID=1037660 RepID=A0A066VHP9_TILAU|nr:uncharacterized protein K437DRAFT_179269 [Tilletiaria anomala UBC 951]KDN41252.1 hypothetical protein K437DRAFT_179269 [Tilletiaria anomala UBC 951]
MIALADQGITKLDLKRQIKRRRTRSNPTIDEVHPIAIRTLPVPSVLRLTLPADATGKRKATDTNDDPIPNWADPLAKFLTHEGQLQTTAERRRCHELSEYKDVPALGPIVWQLSDPHYSHLPHLPPSYTFLETPVFPKNQNAPLSAVPPGTASETPAVSVAVRPLEFVELKWTNSQLTQTSLKSLIRRIEAAQAGLWNAQNEGRSRIQEQRSDSVKLENVPPSERDRGPVSKKKRLTLRPSMSGSSQAVSPLSITPDAAGPALSAPLAAMPPPIASTSSIGGTNIPRRSISLNIRREGRPSLSVIPPSSLSASSSVSSSPVVPQTNAGPSSAIVKSGRLSLRVRTPSVFASHGETAAPHAARTSSASIVSDAESATALPLTARTPLSALYSAGAAKLGLGLGIGMPVDGPMSMSPFAKTPSTAAAPGSAGGGYFSRIHSSLNARRGTFASAFDSSSTNAAGDRVQVAPHAGSFAMSSPISLRVASDTSSGFGIPPSTPATPLTPLYLAHTYPATPNEAQNLMGGSIWRANLFGVADAVSAFSFPPPSPLPPDVISDVRSRAASLSLPGSTAESPAPAGGTAVNATPVAAQQSQQQGADALLESLASLPGVVNFKNSWYRPRELRRGAKQEPRIALV